MSHLLGVLFTDGIEFTLENSLGGISLSLANNVVLEALVEVLEFLLFFDTGNANRGEETLSGRNTTGRAAGRLSRAHCLWYEVGIRQRQKGNSIQRSTLGSWRWREQDSFSIRFAFFNLNKALVFNNQNRQGGYS